MTRLERGVFLPQGDIRLEVGKITRADIVREFGFDYRQIAEEGLRKLWGGELPKSCRLNFFEEPLKHEGSSGLYLLEQIVDGSWVFVQAMLRNGISTKHKHGENVIELYYPLAGESLLSVDGKERILRAGMSFEVSPGQVHQLRTEDIPSLNLLIVKNSAHIPRDELHIPVI